MKLFVNLLTVIRFISTIVLPIIWQRLSPLVVTIYVLAILLTDFFDGFLARKFRVQTLFGAIADAIADKLFAIVFLLIISKYYRVFYLSLLMELIISSINVFAAFRGATTKSSFLGKVKTVILSISMFCAVVMIFYEEINSIQYINNIYYIVNDSLLSTCVYLAVGSEIMVALDYLRRSFDEISSSKNKVVYKFKNRKRLIEVLFDTEYFMKNSNVPLSIHLLK